MEGVVTAGGAKHTDEEYRTLLRHWWGYDDFRGIQLDIIRSIGEGRDTLGLMPTGGGKSITFQVPALASEGTCLVVTPLIALMKDQVDALWQLGIKATALHAGLAREEIVKRLDNCIYGDYKFLYVSPERLNSELFQSKLRRIRISFITVDEAHCISQWGYDFRPAYLEIVNLRKLLPGCPVLALTATATPDVVDDIQERLDFKEKNVFRMSFARTNLSYVVRQAEDKPTMLLNIMRAVPGSAIVYTRSRQLAYETARWLDTQGISALHYHAGLTSLDKDMRQRAWQQGETRVMVATNAFGMGIDKPDVRLVVHLDVPDSLEAYFQEAGRAGRDGQTAYAVLLCNRSDFQKLSRRIDDAFPPKDEIRLTYEHLAYFFQLPVGTGSGVTFEFNPSTFCQRFHHVPTRMESALQILNRAGYIDYRDKEDSAARVRFIVTRDELYDIATLRPEDDVVVQTLLRTCGGIFCDYVSIDEEHIAQVAALTPQEVCETLKRLTFRRILHYVPRKSTPHITYLRHRVDGRNVALGTEVYEQRKKQYKARIHAVVQYAGDNTRCRSQRLLTYFGEQDAAPCGRCDVCLGRRHEDFSVGKEAVILEAIRALCADGKPKPLSQVDRQGIGQRAFEGILSHLVAEGYIRLYDDGTVCPASRS